MDHRSCGEGPDDMVYHFAKWDVPGELIEMPADWDEHGKSAGYVRNAEMAVKADELELFWDGRSNGSRHMRETMNKYGKPQPPSSLTSMGRKGRLRSLTLGT